MGFTGIDSPFEKPVNPDLIIETKKSIQDSAQKLIDFILIKIQP